MSVAEMASTVLADPLDRDGFFQRLANAGDDDLADVSWRVRVRGHRRSRREDERHKARRADQS